MIHFKPYKILLFLAAALLVNACAAHRPLKCNLHVIELTAKRKIYLPNLTANELDVYLKNSSGWHQIPKLKNGKLNHKTAHSNAKKGKTVLASYNSGTNASGHIVMVYGKKKTVWSKSFNANVPYVSGSRQGRKAKTEPLSRQFSAGKEPKMNYFVYTKK